MSCISKDKGPLIIVESIAFRREWNPYLSAFFAGTEILEHLLEPFKYFMKRLDEDEFSDIWAANLFYFSLI